MDLLAIIRIATRTLARNKMRSVLTMMGMAAAGASAAFGKVSAWWLLLATFVITLAELCISVVGLELSYRRALPGTRSAEATRWPASKCA